ncbi:MAG: hypothetical protein QW327_03225 [Candidatus Odinarchaeota archaeon]
MDKVKLKNTYIILTCWSVFLIISVILRFVRLPLIPLTISDNLWILPVCFIPLLTILIEDYLETS